MSGQTVARKRTISSFFVKPASAEEPVVAVSPTAKKLRTEPFEAANDEGRQSSENFECPGSVAKPTEGNLNDDATGAPDITASQKQRMELNKANALAKQARRQAQQRVADAAHSVSLEALLIEPGWRDIVGGEFQKHYFEGLQKFVRQEWAGKTPVYPPAADIFRAFNTCAFSRLRVVILGQDPYHGRNQAMGLSFSVPRGEKIPSSLQNIFKELKEDVGCERPRHGDLDKWATQGVLLLNTALTVRDSQANSHSKKGWEVFTDATIRAISTKGRQGIVFMLWGNSAKLKERLIDSKRHHILKAAHPSGLSASRGFYGCKHFSQANRLIAKQGEVPIDWQIE
ncbi:hypothetical protein CYMTET_44844 [Cymbomonas tetramitiformis]|uniref:Uracil-DNA glycosylase n=1 Tax=Cymbomonas tetramitiformis TaxID=36881 RepID=A0AAE0BZF7_9CHLO|nr:hypothetical protein CYMTET_53662 [Cymbomonas tetramitiformis]KAK3245597.1 hypothetical protein CYMTET_44844 [Cymbomonas tetramitiformis]